MRVSVDQAELLDRESYHPMHCEQDSGWEQEGIYRAFSATAAAADARSSCSSAVNLLARAVPGDGCLPIGVNARGVATSKAPGRGRLFLLEYDMSAKTVR
jgi:hypothetical protein